VLQRVAARCSVLHMDEAHLNVKYVIVLQCVAALVQIQFVCAQPLQSVFAPKSSALNPEPTLHPELYVLMYVLVQVHYVCAVATALTATAAIVRAFAP